LRVRDKRRKSKGNNLGKLLRKHTRTGPLTQDQYIDVRREREHIAGIISRNGERRTSRLIERRGGLGER